MPAPSLQPPSRLVYLAVSAAILLVGAGVTIGTALALGGTQATAWWAAAALAVGSMIGFAPALLAVKADSWGLLVFGSSIARMFAVLAVGYAIDSGQALDRKAFWMALVAGAVFILIAETAFAVGTLVKIERSKQSRPGTPGAGTEPSQA